MRKRTGIPWFIHRLYTELSVKNCDRGFLCHFAIDWMDSRREELVVLAAAPPRTGEGIYLFILVCAVHLVVVERTWTVSRL